MAVARRAGALLYVVRESNSRWLVLRHTPGYIEAIGNSPVALGSISLLGGILVFLFVLVHIAGRRWTREGRFEIRPETS